MTNCPKCRTALIFDNGLKCRNCDQWENPQPAKKNQINLTELMATFRTNPAKAREMAKKAGFNLDE